MASNLPKKPKLIFLPLNAKRWSDFETVLGERGACGGCWCMSWRLPKKQFEQQKGKANKRAMKKLVTQQKQIGVITYAGGKPIAWCAVAPREVYVRLENARVLKRIDDKPVWSIVCFFVIKEYRRKGLSSEILKGVVAQCKKQGVTILEAYPVIPYSDNMPAAFAWTGFLSAFKKAGFVEEQRWSKARPIVRYYL